MSVNYLSFIELVRNARSFINFTLIVGTAIFLSACFHDDDDDNGQDVTGGGQMPTPMAEVRVIHGSPDAPAVNVMLNGTTAISDLDYGDSSGYAAIEAGSYDIGVEGIVPDGNVEVISVDDFDFADDSNTTIIAVNPVATIMPLVVEDSAAEPSATEVALRVVHASNAAAAVDVYVTAPGDDINAASPAFTFDYQDDVDAGALPAGEVRIRVTPATTKTVVYDSGTVDLAPFAGEKLLLVALSTVNPTTQDAAPISILAATDSAAVMLYDVDTGAGARVVHASPDATNAAGGDVEVFATSDALPGSVELIPAFAYLDVVPAVDSHVVVPAGDYVFDVAPDGAGIGSAVYTSETVSLSAASEYTVVASGRVLSAPAFGLLLSEDSSRSIVTQASVKVIHAAPAAGDVDVFVTAAGDYTSAQVESGAAGSPLLDDFAFGDITDYVAVAPGDYDVRVLAGGVTAINIEGLTLAAGSVSTVVARGPLEPSGTPADFGVVLLTN